MTMKIDIRERILNDLETPGYSLGFLIDLRVRHPSLGNGKIIEYDKSFDRIAIWFEKDAYSTPIWTPIPRESGQ
jgi:hypothetical protein